MTSDTPQPPEEPETEGIPADRPLGVDEPGVTAAEQRHGEPLETHLAREEPDVLPDEPAPGVGPDEIAGDEPYTGYDTLEPSAPLGGEGSSAEEVAMRELTEDREITEDDAPQQP